MYGIPYGCQHRKHPCGKKLRSFRATYVKMRMSLLRVCINHPSTTTTDDLSAELLQMAQSGRRGRSLTTRCCNLKPSNVNKRPDSGSAGLRDTRIQSMEGSMPGVACNVRPSQPWSQRMTLIASSACSVPIMPGIGCAGRGRRCGEACELKE